MATISDTLVSSGADLLDMAPQDAFSGEAPSTGEDTSAEVTETAPDTGDVVETEAESAPEPEVEQEAEPETPESTEETEETQEETPQAQPADEVNKDELPEGVRFGKDRNGKPGLFVTPDRWKTIYDNGYKQLQGLQELVGEPLTPEVLDTYQRAYMGQERLFGDILSGQSGMRTDAQGNQFPTGQAAVLGHIFDEAARAISEGEVAGNPMVPFTQQFYQTVQARDPQAYAALRAQAAKDLVEELYNQSAADQNRNLYLALGHVADALSGVGLKYKPEAEMQSFFATRGQQNDPTAALQRQIQELQQQLNGNTAKGQAAQYDTWRNSVDQSLAPASLEEAIKPTVADLANQGVWAKNPDAFNDLVVKRLHERVEEIVRADQGLKAKVSLLMNSARRAVSAQKRAEFGEDIKRLYVARANLAAQSLRQQIAREATNLFVEQNKRAHQRAGAAQTQRAPKSSGTTVQKSLVPNGKNPTAQPGSRFDPDQAVRDLNALLSA